jgi:hypothetical protein
MLNEAYNSVDVTTVTTPTNNAPTKVVTTTVTPVKTAVKV